MTIPYTFHPNLVLRSPKKKLEIVIENDEFLRKACTDKTFLEALFLASPVLHAELIKYAAGIIPSSKDIKKLKFSLAKYYLRMSSRCTPFGLFAGCSVATWSETDTLIKFNVKNTVRHTRFDMHYLCALSQHIASLPFIKNELRYYPNSAWYKLGDEIRYVEYKYKNGKRHHLITSVMASEYVLNILQKAANGITAKEIVEILVTEDILIEEAIDFVEELIKSQLLVNELEPAITGEDFLSQIIKVLYKLHINNSEELNGIIILLEKVQKLLLNIEVAVDNDVAVYQEIIYLIKQLNVAFEVSKLFQTDMSFSLIENNVNIKLQKDIIECLDIINKLGTVQENENLESFRKRFYARYEDAEISLLEVLDTESGIGYIENEGGSIMPLIDNISLSGSEIKDAKLQWNKREQYLMNKLLYATSTNAYFIELDINDIDSFKNNWDLLPPSLSVTFKLIDNGKIFLESASGSSAANLLGRFAHGNSDIHQIIKDIIINEDVNNMPVIFAEIAHLPESRVGNILLHPAFRKFEIPFLSKSSVGTENQILLQDLYISVKNNEVLLHSKKLGKQIIPRLSTAHNYSFKALPAYQFLCDLQLQGKQNSIYFDWGALQNQYKFLPRVIYKNCIVHAASWNFEKIDIEALLTSENEILNTNIEAFKKKWKLPDLIVLADNDNELLVNLNDKLMTEIWIDIVKNRQTFTIKEFLGGTKNVPVIDENNKIYCNQFIATLLRNTPAYNFPIFNERKEYDKEIQQNFSLGTEWLYFKVYCGVKGADIILNDAIHPLVNMLLQQGKIDSFFFIRFSDPDFHLRIRFHIPSIEMVWEVVQLFYQHLKPLLEERYISIIQPDTYKRELTRYGSITMPLSENLFFYDSIAMLKFLQFTEGDEREALRWLWAIRAIDQLLNDFGVDIDNKFILMEQIKNSFHAEYNADRFLKEQLSNKYRTYRKQVEDVLNPALDETSNMAEILQLLRVRSVNIASTIVKLKDFESYGQMEVSITELLPSYIHMLVNKIVSANPRVHELVIYDILFTYYRSTIAKTKEKIVKFAKEISPC